MKKYISILFLLIVFSLAVFADDGCPPGAMCLADDGCPPGAMCLVSNQSETIESSSLLLVNGLLQSLSKMF